MKTPIIPWKQTFCRKDSDASLNLKAICAFTATGFFLEKDTYYNNLEALQPATEYEFDENNFIKSSKKYWDWYYSPKEISLKHATEEFAHIFEKITYDKIKDREIILPLSGGLDSRTQAALLRDGLNVKCYSYKFSGSFDETKYGKEIARIKSIPFTEYSIPIGYLWGVIDELAKINKCYADFTNPRQMAVINEIKELGDLFYLGHWGDVLFDDMGVGENLTDEEQINIMKKKVLKKGGAELAESLWKAWGIGGSFNEYFYDRIAELLMNIKIENTNSRIRAFKSLYWAPRWTSANLNVFSCNREIFLPYYDDEICKFICTVPEEHLSGRQIQIEYIKMKNPALAAIAWQDYDPLNLYNYKNHKNRKMLPSRILRKLKRIFDERILNEKFITRNWEIQFMGKNNENELRKHLFGNKKFSEFIPSEVIKYFYNKFKDTDAVYYSHPVSMLLTLSLFSRKFKDL